MKIQPIAEWRRAHRLTSVRICALMAAIFGIGPALLSAWAALPSDLKDALPHGWSRAIATLGFILVLASHLFCKGEAQQVDEGVDDSQQRDADAQPDAQAALDREARTATTIDAGKQVAALTDGYINKSLPARTRD